MEVAVGGHRRLIAELTATTTHSLIAHGFAYGGRDARFDELGDGLVTFAADELAVFHFSVEGHTDSVGPPEYNDEPAKRRAAAVERFLVSFGVPDARLAAVGRGESVPVAPNGSSAGRQRNRRVELINLGAQP